MKYAVIQIAGKQYQVEPGQKIEIAGLTPTQEKELVIHDVVLHVDGDTIQIGAPVVEKAKVTLKVLEQKRLPKMRVAKYKSKSRYRRVFGYRQAVTVAEVVSIA